MLTHGGSVVGFPYSPKTIYGIIAPRMKLGLLCLVSAVLAVAAVKETKVKLPNSRADLLRGEKLFQVHCALCHGPNGEGGRGPMLTRAKLLHASDDAAAPVFEAAGEGLGDGARAARGGPSAASR